MDALTNLPFLFDPSAVEAVQRFLGLGWPEPWRLITLLGSNWGIFFVLGIGLWLWGRRTAYSVLAVVAVDGLLKTALNSVFSVPRPDGAGIVKYERVELGSFPSGHVSTATGLWAWLALKGRVPWVLAVIVVLLESISRLYLGVHFVGDIFGGILLGALAISLVHWIWPHVEEWLAHRSFSAFVVVAFLALAGVAAGTFFFFGSNPYKWRAGGLVAGLAIALPLEYRFVRYHPGRLSVGRKAAMVAIGTVGIAAIAALDLATGERADSLGFTATVLAGLWTVLVAPTIFATLGWSRDEGPRRQEMVRRTARWTAVGAGLIAALVLYGGVVEPRLMLDTEERTAEIPGLPAAWDGETVAVVADFQVGLWLDNTGLMRRAIDTIVDRDARLAILAGDFIYEAGADPAATIRHVMDILEPLITSGIPTFAVLGNHDWGLARPLGEAEPNREAARLLKEALESAGVTVLHNRSARVPTPRAEDRDPSGGSTGASADQRRPDGALHVVGVGSHYMEQDDPATALGAVPPGAARIAIMHHPHSFPRFPAGTAPLAVAGHTHGGQVRLPFTPQWSWLTFVAEEDIHADGWVESGYGEEGNRLYVTRGLGMSILPMRVNCPPEVTFFTLTAR